VSKTTIEVEEFLYEAELQFTSITEYGVGLEDFVAGKASIPPAGARFDVGFEGSLEGPRVSGHVTGVDYIYVRADGRFELHIHGCINTADDATISFANEGVGTMDEQRGLMQIRYRVVLQTACPDYLWVNGLPVLGRGVVNPATGEIQVKGYAL
jgi:hypothetical protein